jgi:hypothetical protein
VTTATHSLDTTSGATTVAELLARNGRAGRVPHRRSRAATTGGGEFDGTLPAFPPVEDTQYHYDKTTVAALLEEEPAAPRAEESKPGRAGLKFAGIAFAGAVLVGGWALANAQAPDTSGGSASGPVPSNNTPESSPLLAAAPVGAQVVTVASSSASSSPTGTVEIPATNAAQPQQPDHGTFSGKLPAPAAKAPAKTSTPAPKVTAPALPRGTYTWPTNPYDYKAWTGGSGHDHDRHHRPHH